MASYIVSKVNPKEWGGRSTLVFRDDGGSGYGVPGYVNMPGYLSSMDPKPIGARYFPPEPARDSEDNPLPMVVGNTMTGGREAYRENVYKEAKKGGDRLGFTTQDIEDLKPRKVA